MTQSAVLFDLDGVLIDTEGQYCRFWEGIGAEYYPGMSDFAVRIKGHTLTDIYALYFPDMPLEQARITAALNAFEAQMSFRFYPGALDFVAELRKCGYKVAVVTSSNKQKLSSLLAQHPHFYEYFDKVFTAEDAPRSKPFPDCYISAARYWGLEPSDCYVFEDSLSGLQAGLDSGATVIGLSTTCPKESILSLCRLVIEDFTQISVSELKQLKK